jgi:hypothetical protein
MPIGVLSTAFHAHSDQQTIPNRDSDLACPLGLRDPRWPRDIVIHLRSSFDCQFEPFSSRLRCLLLWHCKECLSFVAR